MKKVAIIGNSDFSGTSLLVSTTDPSTSQDIIVNGDSSVVCDFEIKNYSIDPIFIPNPKIRSKFKRKLKYR